MIGRFEKSNSNSFIFGFEESFGCSFGDHARDKDSVVTAQMIAEMTLYYKSIGLSLYEGFIKFCDKYGYYREKLVSIELKGKEGQEKISKCIDYLRNNDLKEINNIKVTKIYDYKLSKARSLIDSSVEELTLPKSNVLKFILEDNSWFVIRPSGTEPKMKIYLSVVGKDLEDSRIRIDKFENLVMKVINNILG